MVYVPTMRPVRSTTSEDTWRPGMICPLDILAPTVALLHARPNRSCTTTNSSAPCCSNSRMYQLMNLFWPDLVSLYSTRTSEGSFACGLCSYVTNKKFNMKTHVEGKHSMSSGYTCDLCNNATYKTKQEVNHHKRVCSNAQMILKTFS